MTRRYYSSIAQRTTLSGSILSGATTIAVVAVTGFPATKPYTLILDQDTVNEEVVTVTASSGTTLTVTRGVDGTTGVAHSAGATVNHGVSARDFDEPNAFINGTGFVSPTLADAKGDLIVATASGTVDRLAVGTNDYVLTADSAEATGVKWAVATAASDATKADKAPEQNPITSTDYTAVLLDVGKTVTRSNAAASTHTIPAQASVSWADNTQLNFLNIGAGTVTITPAADVTINGTPLTLETSKGGSLVRTASNTWTFTPSGGGGGKVLQVVSVTKVDTFTTSSQSYVDVTGLTATITPSSTSSKILVLTKTAINNATASQSSLQTLRGATVIGGGTAVGDRGSATSSQYVGEVSLTSDLAGNYLDSPASTSAETYKIQVRVNTGTLRVNTTGSDPNSASSPRTSSTITLMEISA